MYYAVQASIGTHKFWAESISGAMPRRIVEHHAYGRTGSDTEDTGRNSRRDTIRARLSPNEFASLADTLDKGKLQTFTHPLLGAYKARASITGYNIEGNKPGLINFTLEVVEDISQPLAVTPQGQNARSTKQQAKAAKDAANADLSNTYAD